MMEISSMSSQALALKEQLTNTQIGLAVIKQSAEAGQKMAELLAQNSETVQAPASTAPGGFSTYA